MGSLGLTCDQVKINFPVGLPLRSYFVEEGALSRKRREEKIRKDHIKALDKGDLVFIIFA
jgi:hypothetical protein